LFLWVKGRVKGRIRGGQGGYQGGGFETQKKLYIFWIGNVTGKTQKGITYREGLIIYRGAVGGTSPNGQRGWGLLFQKSTQPLDNSARPAFKQPDLFSMSLSLENITLLFPGCGHRYAVSTMIVLC
jgi:hypothetical protein